MLLEFNTTVNDDQTLPIHEQPKIILTTQMEINQLSALLDSPVAAKLLDTTNWNGLRDFLDQQADSAAAELDFAFANKENN